MYCKIKKKKELKGKKSLVKKDEREERKQERKLEQKAKKTIADEL